ncbi:MAG: DUF5330 domain-containing protein [Hyphomicrobiaceae bacterium]|nr:DUF5330 domain-containing protein [Hyphomicrobiaceae bacterium]
MGLLRLTFWLALIVAILPTDKDRQAQVISAFSSGTTWVLTFCDRNGEACKKGSEAWQVFKTKAEFGGRLVATFVFDRQPAVEETRSTERVRMDYPQRRRDSQDRDIDALLARRY